MGCSPERAMTKPPAVHPVAAAMQWVGRIMAAGLMMVLPGLGGHWLDQQLGSGFFALAGFALGLVGGMTYLIAITKKPSRTRPEQPGDRHD